MFCPKCGAEVSGSDLYCSKCGEKLQKEEKEVKQEIVYNGKRDKTILTLGLVLCIVNTVFFGFVLIPLLWMVPMCVSLNGKIERNEAISVGFKVCLCIFVSLFGGIFIILGDDKD